MSKFGGLFDDDSDDGAPPPPVAVPKPPQGGNLEPPQPDTEEGTTPSESQPQAEESVVEQQAIPAAVAQPPVVPTLPIASTPAQTPQVVPDSVRSVASSIAPSVVAAQAPLAFNPAASMPVLPSNPAPVTQADPLAASLPVMPAAVVDAAALDNLAKQNSEIQTLQKTTADTLQTTTSDIDGKLSELMKQMEHLTVLNTPVPTEDVEIPDLKSFPSFKVSDSMQEIKEDFEGRQKSWCDERNRVLEDANKLDSEEKERDSQVLQKHNSEQIQQLRREKDDLRKELEAVQTQLAGAESDLQQAVARDAQEIADFKKSFNVMMQQQADEIEELKKSLKEQTERTEQLQVFLSTKKQQADERLTKIQEQDLLCQSLRVEKADFETRFIMTSKSLDTSKLQLDEMRAQLKTMCDEKAALSQSLDDASQAKYIYVNELRKRHDEHLDMMAAKYQEREAYYVSEYASKEKSMREDLLKFSSALKKTSEEMLGRFRSEYAKELKEQSDSFYTQAKAMKAKHKAAIIDADVAREQLRQDSKKKIQDLEERMASREETLHKQHGKELDEARKRFDKAQETSDKRLSDTVRDLRNEMSAKATAAKQQETKALQTAHLEAKTKLAEMETQHRIKTTHMDKKSAEDKEQLMAMFSRELGKIGEEHRKAERELERLHRDREGELEKRLKLLNTTSEATTASVAHAAESARLKDDLVGKWDKHRQALRDRHESVKRTIEEN
eukprot:TRINITY_DN3480_c0_g1_i1.p1 TRINITY_DN3480_c0_g1~~TRINITY_DN3480_c0_g1_i1.p1  ORF type:complete len:727 (+),score=235.40 TRINITY_DN3480_c0_g1_i1:40-2220(+)